MDNVAQAEHRTRVVVNLTVSVDRAAEIEAAKQNVSKRDVVEDALRQYLGLKARGMK